jgi:GNAT superfamily N-acetyltransferase
MPCHAPDGGVFANGSILKVSMSIEIRIAVAGDAFAACHVLRRSIIECCVEDHRNDPAILAAWLGNKTPEMVASWFASPRNFSIVAIEDGELIGVALLTRAGKLSLCYLLPEALRHGAGTALMASLEAQAREWGIKSLQLHSTATAAQFYASCGFIRSGKVKSPYGVETTFFWKPLDPSVDVKRARFCNCNTGP